MDVVRGTGCLNGNGQSDLNFRFIGKELYYVPARGTQATGLRGDLGLNEKYSREQKSLS